MSNRCKLLSAHYLHLPAKLCILQPPQSIYLTNRLINQRGKPEFYSEDMATMKKAITTVALLVLLSMTALAATGRYDQQIQQAVSNKIHDAKQLQSVQASVEDGIVTLTCSVDLLQDKLDAAKKVKKLANVSGV